MEAKSQQRRTRIVDENDPAVMAAAAAAAAAAPVGRHRKTASTASTKSSASLRPRAGQSTKRVALSDSTQHETSIANKAASNQTSKGGPSKAAVRGKPLATKSTASLATGAKNAQQQQQQQTKGQRSASTSIKSTIYRDQPQQNQVKAPVKTAVSAEARTQAARKKPLVYRDQPDQPVAAAAQPLSPPIAVHEHDWPPPPARSVPSETTACIQKTVAPAPKEEKPKAERPKPVQNWEDDDWTVPCNSTKVSFEDKPHLVGLSDDESQNGPFYNPMRQLAKTDDGSLRYYPLSGWASHERDSPSLTEGGVTTDADDDEEEDASMEEYSLFRELAEVYKAREECGAGDRMRVYPEYSWATDLEVVQAVKTHARDTRFHDLDLSDPLFAKEYAGDILRHTFEVDAKLTADPYYMDTQPHLEWHMRGILVDWLIEVHDRFQYDHETLFGTINIVDRFLSVKIVPVDQLQLVGLAALLIAAKYDEITPPSMDILVYMADDAFTGKEIRSCEYEILNALKWEISAPGPMSFLRCVSTADLWEKDVRDLATYFLEAALMEVRFVGTPWSYIVAAAHYVAMIMLDCEGGEWTPAHVYYSGHCASQLAPAVQVIIEMMANPEQHHKATFGKFNRKIYRRIAGFVERWMVAQFNHVEIPSPDRERAVVTTRDVERELKIQRKMDKQRRQRLRDQIDR